MKNKKLIFIVIGGLVLIIITLLTIMIIQKNGNKPNEDYKPIYLTLEDITNIEGCYDWLENDVSCEDNYNVYAIKYKEKDYVQKVLVDLNDTDKAIFTVLKGNIEQDEDLLLIYDGLYVLNENEAYYTYDRGLEVLNNLNWKNTKAIRLLTEDEAILLGCTEGSEACSWLVEEPEENQSSINNSLGGHYGFGFTIYHEPEFENDNRIYFINAQGFLINEGFGDNEDTYGLRPVIQINSKYAKPYSDIDKIYMEKENQSIYAKFVNDKLTNLKITNTHSNLNEEAYNQLKKELDEKVETDNITFGGTSSNIYGEREVIEYIYINCKNTTLDEIGHLISLSSLDISPSQFINEMKNQNYIKSN